jgi:DNA-binding transcriptional MocR family regulator
MAVISFARGAPAPECLDAETLADCARVALERDPGILGYGPAGGYAPLREWIAGRHGVDAARVALTNGALQGFAFYARTLLAKRAPRVLVEAPTYDRPLKLLAELGVVVEAVPQDDDGLDPDALEAALGRGEAAFLYTIPTFQNPSGRTLGEDRRRRIVELCATYDLHVLEDDPYGLVRYSGDPLPSIHALEGGERVTFTSSFSKTVAPGLRVGWFVVPEAMRADYDDRAVSTYISPPLLPQAIVHELFSRGGFEPNLDRIRGILGAQRDAMLASLEADLAGRAAWSTPDGGYFVWLDLGDGVDAAALLGGATDAGVTFVKGADFFVEGGGKSAARLAFSYEPPERIAEGIRLLGSLL